MSYRPTSVVALVASLCTILLALFIQCDRAQAEEPVFAAGTQFKPGQVENKEKQKVPCGTAEEVEGKIR